MLTHAAKPWAWSFPPAPPLSGSSYVSHRGLCAIFAAVERQRILDVVSLGTLNDRPPERGTTATFVGRSTCGQCPRRYGGAMGESMQPFPMPPSVPSGVRLELSRARVLPGADELARDWMEMLN